MIVAALFAFARASVSFSAPAAPAERLLPAIGKVLGIEMRPDPRLAKEVLLVKAAGVSRAELMKHLSEATGGSWEFRDGIYRLTLSGAADSQQRRSEAIARGLKIRTLLLQTVENFPRKIEPGMPSGLPEAVMARCSPEMLGEVSARRRIVFSTRPTAMQYRLDPELLNGLDLSKLAKMARIDGEGNPVSPLPGTAAIVLFALQSDLDGLIGKLILSDAKGRVIGGEASMPLYSGEELATPWKSKLLFPDASIRLPKAAQSLAKEIKENDVFSSASIPTSEGTWGPGTAMYTAEELSAPALQLDTSVFEPEIQEPLAAILGSGFGRLADSQKVNLVAVLPDAAYQSSAAFFADGPVTAARLEQSAEQKWDLNVGLADGWLTVTPRSPAKARADRADRAALGKLLRQLRVKRDLTLSQQADYAMAQPIALPIDSLEGPLVGLVDVDWGRHLAYSSVTGERSLLRIYRSLGARPEMGEKLFGSLSASTRSQISEWIFNAPVGPAVKRALAEAGSEISTIEYYDHYSDTPESLNLERTVYLGNGIPSGATLRLGLDAKTVFFGQTPRGVRPALTGEGGSGTSINAQANGPLQVATSSPHLASYVPGQMLDITLALSMGDLWRCEQKLYETHVDPQASPVGFDRLPQELQDQVNQAEKSIRESLDQMNSHRNGSGAGQP